MWTEHSIQVARNWILNSAGTRSIRLLTSETLNSDQKEIHSFKKKGEDQKGKITKKSDQRDVADGAIRSLLVVYTLGGVFPSLHAAERFSGNVADGSGENDAVLQKGLSPHPDCL